MLPRVTRRPLHAPASLALPLALLGIAGALVLRGDQDGLGDLVVHGAVLPLLAAGWWWTAGRHRSALGRATRGNPLQDPHTGLANRFLFADRVAGALTRHQDGSGPVVVLYCDVDDLGSVNRHWGRQAGDAVIAEIGRRLLSAVREGDTVARLHGDEFAVVLTDGSDLAAGEHLAGLLERALAQPYVVAGNEVRVSTSIGVAEALPGECCGEQPLRDTDVSLEWAKGLPRSTVAVWSPALQELTQAQQTWRADLRRAVDEGQLVLHYQPTVDLATQDIIGFEALVRWDHPERGLLQPVEFVPLAEQCDLILGLGEWVLAEACRAGAQLQGGGHRPTMAVNIAARQLASPTFVEQVTAALATSGLPADRLVLEITETVVLDDMASVVARLSALRDLGIGIAIDDFGSGYNSLSYLSQLPVDMLKVDKSFVDQVCADEHGAAVAEGIIAMSRTMNLRTIAEGVELPEQASWLRKVACSQGQGFLWSRPVELERARRLLLGGPLPAPA